MCFFAFPHASPDNVSPRYQARRFVQRRLGNSIDDLSAAGLRASVPTYPTPEIKAYQRAPIHIAKRGNPGPPMSQLVQVSSGLSVPSRGPPICYS